VHVHKLSRMAEALRVGDVQVEIIPGCVGLGALLVVVVVRVEVEVFRVDVEVVRAVEVVMGFVGVLGIPTQT
jgi:hypothetical protein